MFDQEVSEILIYGSIYWEEYGCCANIVHLGLKIDLCRLIFIRVSE